MKKAIKLGFFASILFATLASCKKDDGTQVTLITKTDSIKVNFGTAGGNTFTFFNFKEGKVIANTDSATANWDFGIRFTTFLVNSNSSGPGNAGVILQNSIYSNVTVAPDAGYAYDTTTTQRAIKDGSWYNYNPTTRTFSPKAGQTFIFKSAQGFYVKMELLATDYEPFIGTTPLKLIYKFRYTYQASGAKAF